MVYAPSVLLAHAFGPPFSLAQVAPPLLMQLLHHPSRIKAKKRRNCRLFLVAMKFPLWVVSAFELPIHVVHPIHRSSFEFRFAVDFVSKPLNEFLSIHLIFNF
jgi:hypothetical protein